MRLAHKASVYLDTSVINFLFADDAPEKRDTTIEFFENYQLQGLYDVFVSSYVIQEIENTLQADKRFQLLNLIVSYDLPTRGNNLETDTQALAGHYLTAGVLPQKSVFDALHVAYCVVHQINFLASWNFRHLANAERERRLMAASMEIGYLHQLRIVSPEYLISYGT